MHPDMCRDTRTRKIDRAERPTGRTAVPLLITLLLLFSVLFQLPPAGANLGVQPGNLDLGPRGRGDRTTAEVTLRNGGADTRDIVVGFEGDEGVDLTAAPTSFTLPPGAERTVQIDLDILADAAPGRSTARFLATASAVGSGAHAVGAVVVQIHYSVDALDVAFGTVLQNDTVFLRIVNGHDTARSVDAQMTTSGAGGTIETANVTGRAVAAGGNLILYEPLKAVYPPGTYTLHVAGEATGGPAPGPFDASFAFTRDEDGGTPGQAAPASGAGGGGGGPRSTWGPASTPDPDGEWRPDVFTDPVREGAASAQEGRKDVVAGNEAPAERMRATPGLAFVRDSLTYSLVVTAFALVAGLAVFLGRARSVQ